MTATSNTTPKPAPDGFKSARKAAVIGNYNSRLQGAILDYLWADGEPGRAISIPPFRKHYKEQIKEIFDFEAYDDALYKHFDELCKFYYALGENRVFLAQFTDKSGFEQINKPVGQFYSKHRLDPIWNSSKSRKFRYLMSNFLEKEKWYEMYQPTHLVLTVPHKNGIWNGKRIYIHELIKAFRQLRDNRWWKDCFAGGLYCLEVKKNKVNGYHIHLHVLCFQYPEILEKGKCVFEPVNYVREKVKNAWKRIVGNDSGYDGIHYGSLFVYEKDEAGNRIPVENAYIMTSDEDPDQEIDGEWQIDPSQEIDMGKFKKRYIKYGDDLETWTQGVMECLKYHFKPGVLEKEDGTYDMELIMELLEHTKGDRMMSKFGQLHNHPGLSLTGKKATEEEEDEELDNEMLGSAKAAQDNLINPFTDEIATPDDYIVIVTKPECILVSHDARGRPNIKLRTRSPVSYFEPGTTIAEAFKCHASRKYFKQCEHTTTDQLALKGNGFWKKPDRVPVPEKVKVYSDDDEWKNW